MREEMRSCDNNQHETEGTTENHLPSDSTASRSESITIINATRHPGRAVAELSRRGAGAEIFVRATAIGRRLMPSA